MIGEALKSVISRIRGFFSKDTNLKLPYLLTAGFTLLIVVGGINLFVELTAKVKGEMLGMFDNSVTERVLSFRSDGLTDYFVLVTNIGDVRGYLIILAVSAILSYLIFKKLKYVGQVTLVLALASLSNVVLKRFIDRARPEIEHLVSVKTLSYPSGHAMSSMAFYGFVAYLIYKAPIHNLAKMVIILLLFTLTFSIGLSRIYLGVHFPSDIVGGWIAGLIWVFFCILMFNLVEVFRKDPQT